MLEAKMAEYGDNCVKLADYLGIARQTCALKINGEREFKQSEIDKIAKRYDLTPHDVVLIFLT